MASHLKIEQSGKHYRKSNTTAGTLKKRTAEKRKVSRQGKKRRKQTDSISLKHDVALSLVLFLVLLFIKISHPTKVITSVLDIAVIIAAGYILPLEVMSSIHNKQYFNSSVLYSAAALLLVINNSCGAAATVCVCWRFIRAARGLTSYRSDLILANITSSVPSGARLLSENDDKYVSVKAIHAGDIIVIRKGESAAFDGFVVKGESAADISAFAGNSTPVPLHPGSLIYAGSVNLTNDIQVKVTKEYNESFTNNFARTAEQAVNGKADLLRFTEMIAKYLSPVLTGSALIVGLVYIIRGSAWTGINFAAVILLIAGMSEIVGAVSASYVSAVANSARHGVLFKQSFLISAMAKVRTVVTSQVGIVTTGNYEVTEIHPVSGLSETELLSIAVAAEAGSDHPIAIAIKNAGSLINLTTTDVLKVEENSGRGITAFIGDHHVYVGNADHINEHNIIYTAENYNGNVVHVAVDNKYCGCLLLKDTVRNGAFEALDDLRLKGIRSIIMLTGCTRNVSRSLARSLNYDMVKPELSSDEKLSALNFLQSGKEPGSRIAFIGDYATDHDLLNLADLGIAMKTLGNQEAIDNADVCVLGDDLSSVSGAYTYCLEADRAAKINLYINLGIKGLTLLFVILNILPAYIAAILISVGIVFSFGYANVDFRIEGASVKIGSFFSKLRSLLKKH